MNSENGAQQDRHQRKRNKPRKDAKDESEPTDDFPDDRDIGEPARQAERAEEARRTGRCESENRSDFGGGILNGSNGFSDETEDSASGYINRIEAQSE